MKKLLLFTVAAAFSVSGYSQSAVQLNQTSPSSLLTQDNGSNRNHFASTAAAKSTHLSDTLTYVTVAQGDSLFPGVLYSLGIVAPADSGYVFGMNPLNLSAFSDWYGGVYGNDTTLNIIGVKALFGGHVSPTSTKQINIKVWKSDTTHVNVGTHFYYRDYPGTQIGTSITKTINHIGIHNDTASLDTVQYWYWPTANQITGISTDFHVGYDISYQWANNGGDSIGAHSTRIGSGWGAGFYYLSGLDTIVYAQTCLKAPTGWVDGTQYGLGQVNLSIVPIFQFHSTVGLHGVKSRNLAILGNYPNPAVDNTTIKFALVQNSDVTIEITDLAGHIIKTISESNLSSGEHAINVSTSELAAGNYIYTITSKLGGAMACQFTVVK